MSIYVDISRRADPLDEGGPSIAAVNGSPALKTTLRSVLRVKASLNGLVGMLESGAVTGIHRLSIGLTGRLRSRIRTARRSSK